MYQQEISNLKLFKRNIGKLRKFKEKIQRLENHGDRLENVYNHFLFEIELLREARDLVGHRQTGVGLEAGSAGRRNSIFEDDLEYFSSCFSNQMVGFRGMKDSLVKQTFLCEDLPSLFGKFFNHSSGFNMFRHKTSAGKSFDWFKKKMTVQQENHFISKNSCSNKLSGFFDFKSDSPELNMVFHKNEVLRISKLVSGFLCRSPTNPKPTSSSAAHASGAQSSCPANKSVAFCRN